MITSKRHLVLGQITGILMTFKSYFFCICADQKELLMLREGSKEKKIKKATMMMKNKRNKGQVLLSNFSLTTYWIQIQTHGHATIVCNNFFQAAAAHLTWYFLQIFNTTAASIVIMQSLMDARVREGLKADFGMEFFLSSSSFFTLPLFAYLFSFGSSLF